MAAEAQLWLDAAPVWSVQLGLMAAWAAVWFFALPALRDRVFKPVIAKKPWRDRWTALNRAMIKKMTWTEFDEALAFHTACDFLSIITQHALGGFMAMPSAIGLQVVPGAIRGALARHGALCEAGWELQDIVVRSCFFVFTEDGRKANPPGLLLIFALHHIMGISMVVPMNMYYGQNTYYHELVFMLQLAAFTSMFSQQYGFTLDPKTRAGLAQMQVSVVASCLMVFYSRAGRYLVVGYHLLVMLYTSGARVMLVGGIVTLLSMSVVNFNFCAESIAKLRKFMRMRPEDEAVETQIVDASSPIEPCPMSPVRASSPTSFGAAQERKKEN
uniref:TLC domain-containing protein n=1 Tax=Zooxanthella nutricula TaxID=1333877 RepID=A0A7S2NGK7_9DINO